MPTRVASQLMRRNIEPRTLRQPRRSAKLRLAFPGSGQGKRAIGGSRRKLSSETTGRRMAFPALPDAPEWEALRLSLLVAALAVVIALPFAVASAWIVSRSRTPGRGVVIALIHLPLVLPPIVI